MRYTIEEPGDLEVERETSRFLAAAWDDYHRAEGHDLSYDWIGHGIRLVARDEAGTLVAVASGRRRAGVGHLSDLMVAAGLRGQGVGRSLLEAFESTCWRAGCHKLTVHTELEGSARGFYERHGWVAEAVYRNDRGGLDFARLCKFRDALQTPAS